MPWASALYACDGTWWERNKILWQDFAGYRFTWCKLTAGKYGLRHVHGKKGEGLGTKCLHAGGSSAYMAVNLAWFMGAAEICLLGFDMQYTGGKSHWHGDHTKTGNPSPNMLKEWAAKFVPLHADLATWGVPLINCTRETALTIPRRDIDDVLSSPTEHTR